MDERYAPNGARERTNFEEPNSLMILHMLSSQVNSVIIRKEYRPAGEPRLTKVQSARTGQLLLQKPFRHIL